MPEIAQDEFGRSWLISDDGKPFSGPYDAPEDAQRRLDEIEDDAAYAEALAVLTSTSMMTERKGAE